MIHWSNDQWSVTRTGLDEITDHGGEGYYIYIEDLTRTRSGEVGGDLYDWPMHMAEKSWVNSVSFCEAFIQALKIHGDKCEPSVDWEMAARSVLAAVGETMIEVGEPKRKGPVYRLSDLPEAVSVRDLLRLGGKVSGIL